MTGWRAWVWAEGFGMGRVETWGDDDLSGVYVLSKLIKLYNLNMFSLLCVNRTSTELWKNRPGHINIYLCFQP